MKSNTPSGTVNSSLVISGNYIKIIKSENVLYISYAKIVSGPGFVGGVYTNIITFTNWNNTSIDISFPTSFVIGANSSTWENITLPLAYKSFVLKLEAADPSG